MVASTIGPGPRELSAWLWAFSIGITASLALAAALSFLLALGMTNGAERSGR